MSVELFYNVERLDDRTVHLHMQVFLKEQDCSNDGTITYVSDEDYNNFDL